MPTSGAIVLRVIPILLLHGCPATMIRHGAYPLHRIQNHAAGGKGKWATGVYAGISPRLSDLFLGSQTDERLVALARTGHDRAFAEIVKRYRPELVAHARRLDSGGRSEDIAQQALLNAYAALRGGTEVKHLRGWLHRIVRNGAVKEQGPRHAPLDELVPAAESLEDLVQHRALARSALSAMRKLPDGQREALVGTALRGVARAELASSLGVSEGAVRQLVHRARTTLRSAVTALVPWPLLRWLGPAGPVSGGATELTAGVGALGGGGALLKLGAVLATTGALVAGIGTSGRPSPQVHHLTARGGRAPVHMASSAPSPRSTVRALHEDVVARRPITVPATVSHPAAPLPAKATGTSRKLDARAGEHRDRSVDRRQAAPSSAERGRTSSNDGPRTSSNDGGRTRSGDGERTSSGDGQRTTGVSDGGSGGHDGSSSNLPSALDAVDGSGSSGSSDGSSSHDGSGSNGVSGSSDGVSQVSG